MNDKTTDFAKHRWKNGSRDPTDHKPRDAAEAILRDMDLGELDVEHMIIIYKRTEENGGGVGWYQAGSLKGYAQVGLLSAGLHTMHNS